MLAYAALIDVTRLLVLGTYQKTSINIYSFARKIAHMQHVLVHIRSNNVSVFKCIFSSRQ